MRAIPHDSELDELQRFGLRYDDDEPETGNCWNCGHRLNVFVGGKCYDVCARRHDENGDGDADEAPMMSNCEGWVAM